MSAGIFRVHLVTGKKVDSETIVGPAWVNTKRDAKDVLQELFDNEVGSFFVDKQDGTFIIIPISSILYIELLDENQAF